MDTKARIRASKYLSRHLRHCPERLGLTLGTGGWVEVSEVLAGCERNGFKLTREQLEEVVETSDKQRFSFDSTGQLIRANQGHTVEVDLELEPREPPSLLFHGTAGVNVPSIFKQGLLRGARHHVHLSVTVETAIAVGKRHGKPVVLEVQSGEMQRDGFVFYCSDNGVWLVDHVPVQYLRVAG